MSMQDVLQALMQSSSGAQSQSQPQSGAGADPLAQALGGIVGGGQQSGGILGGLLGGLLGGGQQSSGGSAATQVLGGLEQIIGGQPGSGQLTQGAGTAMSGNLGNNDPIMMLLQPVVNQVAAKVGISPQIATVVASIALHYLLNSHPSTPGSQPLNLGSVMQQLSSGGISPSALQKSGMVNDVVQATGLNQAQATKSLTQTFNVLGTQVQGAKGIAKGKRNRG